MAREQNEVQGIIPVDKPKDWTSHDVIAKLRGAFKIKKIGHSGTLDPMATGLLAVLCGKSTKLSDPLMASKKTYEMTVRFGVETNTQDITGEVVRESPLPEGFGKEMLLKALPEFRGEIEQLPPMFSAIKVKGKKLYDIARKGQEIEREKRKVTIYDLELIDMKDNEAKLRCVCSKGTYVRTLAHDIGQRLGCGGTLTELRRTEGSFLSIEEAFSLDEILNWDLERLRAEAEKNLEKAMNLLAKAAKPALLALIALLMASCAQKAEEKADVYVSIPPLLPFAQRLAGPDVKCESFMSSGANPHSYEPSPRQGAGFYESKLFIMTGLPFEKELAKRAKSGKGPKLLDLAREEADHERVEAHHHHDQHIWLSPRLMAERVQDMAAALCELYPEKEEEIGKRAEEIKEELKDFDEELKETFKDGNKVFLVFHPAYSLFAEDYGLTEIAVEKEGSEPTPKSLSEAMEKAKSENISSLIVQPGMNERLAKNIADTAKLKIIRRDALSTNYYDELRALAKNIKGEE